MRTLGRARAAIARLPHTGPARLVEDAAAIDDRAIETAGRVPAGSAWIRDGRVPAYVLLEFAAQSAAAFEIAAEAAGEDAGPAAQGFVVRVRSLRCARLDVPAEAVLRARVTLDGEAPPLAVYRFEAFADGESAADGVFATFVERPD